MARAIYSDGTQAKVGDIVSGPGIGQFDRGTRDICVVVGISESEVFNLDVRRSLTVVIAPDGSRVVIPREFDGHSANQSKEWTKIL